MNHASLFLPLVVIGCATAAPVISTAQSQTFADVIRDAEAEGAASEPPEAARLLREAKSGFAYAQRLPMDPDHALRVLAKAQADAEAALQLARRRHQEQEIVSARLRHQAAVDALAAGIVPVDAAARAGTATGEQLATATPTSDR